MELGAPQVFDPDITGTFDAAETGRPRRSGAFRKRKRKWREGIG
eukprot:gene9904-10798_t